MKAGIEKVYYSAQDPKTYLVAVLSDRAPLEEFCIEMAQRNRIPALLPMQDHFVNGTTELLFDISGQNRLLDVLKGLGDAKAMAFVLLNCCKAFQELYDYFLHPAQCILDPDHIFIGHKQEVCFALVPIAGEPLESNGELRQMFMTLVGACSAVSDKEKADILGYLVKPNFSLPEFEALLEKRLGVAKEDIVSNIPQKQMPIAAPQQIGSALPKKESPEKKAPEKKFPEIPKAADAPAMKIPAAQEVQIPGGGKVAIPMVNGKAPEAKHKKPEKSNKKFLGGLFDKKKAAPLDLDIEMHQVQGGAVAPSALSPTSTPQAPVARGQSEQWRGTIELQSSSMGTQTEFIGETSATKRLVLVHNGQQVPVTVFPFTVGRELCSYLINNPKVSRHHITISFADGVYTVTDNNSSNHTYYNDSMLAPYTAYELEDGATLRLGNEIILISIK